MKGASDMLTPAFKFTAGCPPHMICCQVIRMGSFCETSELTGDQAWI